LIHSQASLKEGDDPNNREIFRCEYLVAHQKEFRYMEELQTLVESYRALGFELKIEGPLPPAQFAKRNTLPVATKRTAQTHESAGKPIDLSETA
jgi:hypothetical protein